MLSLYRRHEKHCRNRGKPRTWMRRNPDKCSCPVHCDGSLALEPKRVRESMGTRNWSTADRLRREWEDAGRVASFDAGGGLSFRAAAADFLRYQGVNGGRRGDGLDVDTLGKYRLLFDRLAGFLDYRGLRLLEDLTAALLDEFVVELAERQRPSTRADSVAKLKCFLRRCQRLDLIEVDLAGKLETPKVKRSQPQPFTDGEFLRLLEAANARPMDRAFCLFMRYTGFAIEDAATCPKEALGPLEWFETPDGGRLELAPVRINRVKTGEPVEAWLPRFVVEALERFAHRSARYWFWTEQGRRDSAAKDMGRRLKRVFREAGLPDGHPHRLRHTFSAKNLEGGAAIEDVSLSLGHSNPNTTARYYLAITRGRLDRAKSSVSLALTHDPVAKMLASGTREAREEIPRAN